MSNERIVGIDLGATNSLVAYMEGDDSEEARARIQARDTADQDELAARLALRDLGRNLNALRNP